MEVHLSDSNKQENSSMKNEIEENESHIQEESKENLSECQTETKFDFYKSKDDKETQFNISRSLQLSPKQKKAVYNRKSFHINQTIQKVKALKPSKISSTTLSYSSTP